MQTLTKTYGILLAAALLTACGPQGSLDSTQTQRAEQTADEIAALALINDQTLTDLELLDVDCALRSDAAENIIRYRDGYDGEPGTVDDNPIDSVAELESVHRVGPVTVGQLKTCADGFGLRPTPDETALLNLVNDQENTTWERLDLDCTVGSDAVANILAHRDGADRTAGSADDNLFHSVEELLEVAMVTPSIVEQLSACAVHFGYGQPQIVR